jgi:hypothetical protein
MNEPRGARDLFRLRWATLVLPLVFVWGFEVVRLLVLDPQLQGDAGHVASAMIMGVAIIVFATIVSIYLDRTQKQLVATNKDLTVTHAVRLGGPRRPVAAELLEQSLERVITPPGALAGIVTITASDGEPLTLQRPAKLAPGLTWLEPLLAEAPDPALDGPRYSRRPGLDTGILDLALVRGTGRLGHLRLALTCPSCLTSPTPRSSTSRARCGPPSWG